jgi:hypothetical protein
MVLDDPVERGRPGGEQENTQQKDYLLSGFESLLNEPEDDKPFQKFGDEILQSGRPPAAEGDRENARQKEKVHRPIQNARRRLKDLKNGSFVAAYQRRIHDQPFGEPGHDTRNDTSLDHRR